MVSKIAKAAAALGGAGLLALMLARAAAAAVRYTLEMSAQADTAPVEFDSTVDDTPFPVPGSLALPPGDYTVTIPESVVVGGETYRYLRSEVE